MVRAQLRGHYEITLAEGGEQALCLIEGGFAPDIVLLDIDMPGLDGYGTLERLRANPDTEDIPVVFLTALNGVRDQVKGLESGVVDYITKPFVRDIMLARLRLHLEAGMERRKMRHARKNGLLVELDEEKLERLADTLNGREKKVAQLMILGYSNQEIAATLTYSLDGVKKLTTRVFNKTGLPDRYELKNFFWGNIAD
jgi:DNA-binding response OmpR family regulator